MFEVNNSIGCSVQRMFRSILSCMKDKGEGGKETTLLKSMPNSVRLGLISCVIAEAVIARLSCAVHIHSYNFRTFGKNLHHVFNWDMSPLLSSTLFYVGQARIWQVYLNQHQIPGV